MATLKLRYVNSYRDRHGKLRHYFRKGTIRAPLDGAPGSAVFMKEYQRLLAQHAPAPLKRGKSEEGTVAWVIAQYRAKSKDWAKAKPSSRAVYETRFAYLDDNFGVAEFGSFTERDVRAIRNKLADTRPQGGSGAMKGINGGPSVADAVVNMIGRLWRFAKEHIDGMDTLGANPTTEVAAIHTEHEAHKAWPSELCAMIEAHPNPKVVRAYFLLRYTGQRRSDVVRMKTSQFDGTAVQLVQYKTGTYVWMPAHRALRDHLAQTGIRGEYLLTNRSGRRYNDRSLSNLITKTVEELGFPGYSAHGLRHLAGAALAESGASVHEIMSILGHLTEKEAMEYTRQANRKKMAASGMKKWGGD